MIGKTQANVQITDNDQQLAHKHQSKVVPLSAKGSLLQRKCACGGVPGPSGECEACRRKRLAAQHQAASHSPADPTPTSVHQALRTPGQPLEAGTCAAMEARFGHGFGHVRIHTDARAAESARDVNALAYTVGQDIVFGAGQYAPATREGQRLLAHELTHVLQQGQVAQPAPTNALPLSQPGDAFEQEANAIAAQVAEPGAERAGSALPQASLAQVQPLHSRPAIQRDIVGGLIGGGTGAVVGGLAGLALGGPVGAGIGALVGGAAGVAIGASASGSSGSSRPYVTLGHFRTSGSTDAENQCPICPATLGIDTSTGLNTMEIRGDITGHVAAAQYDIKRTKERATWKRAGSGAWSQITHVGPGADDDSHNDDEDLTPQNDHIFVIDTPGFQDLSDPVGDASATEAVYKSSFVETANVRVGTGSWAKSSNDLQWHSISWLEKVGGSWRRKAGKSEISTGSTTVGTGDP